ncbi:MAG TPA: hypothetical protein VKB93_07910 [Thermoanaerobaculia bacterium]|nr:hypothetical protein [Thermoanaerobaculia bacterium]
MKRLFVLVVVLSSLSCRTREKAIAELDTRLTNETARLEAQIKAINPKQLPEDLAGMTQGFGESFARIRATKSPTLRLYRLRDTFIGIETISFFAANPKAGQTLGDLHALVASRRAAYEAKLDAPKGPVLFRALAEQSANRARVLYRASEPYGKISDPMWGGLYYLGEAEGNLKFRDFVTSLPADVAPGNEPHAEAARLTAAANQIQQETLAFFEKSPGANAAVSASMKLKEARELLAANLADGATLALVEAKLALERRKAEADPGSVHDGAKPAAQAKETEDSIPALLQAYTKEGPAPVPVIVAKDVVPFYASLLTPLAARSVITPAAVTVTLVRWPYT